jgi:hypothetical protein
MEDSLIGEIFFLIVAAGIGWALKGLIPAWFRKDPKPNYVPAKLNIGTLVQATKDVYQDRIGTFVMENDKQDSFTHSIGQGESFGKVKLLPVTVLMGAWLVSATEDILNS